MNLLQSIAAALSRKPGRTRPARSARERRAATPFKRTLLAESIEQRVLLAADPLSVARVNGSVDSAGEVDHFSFHLDNVARLSFDSLTENGNLHWNLVGPAGAVVNGASFRGFSGSDGNYAPLDLGAGDYRVDVYGSGDTTGAYEIANPERVEHLIVMLPKAQMADRGLRLDGLMARSLGTSGISRVALETMRNTYLELPHMSPAAAQGAGEMIKQLVQLSLMELAGQETASTQRAALRDRIRGHVAQHLRDPNLSVDGIARALNCSRRHLYNAFSGEGESIAAYIQRMRLQACVRDLQAAGPHGRPITDIAMSWGFGNLSHFSRVFREHTGASPSEFRNTPHAPSRMGQTPH